MSREKPLATLELADLDHVTGGFMSGVQQKVFGEPRAIQQFTGGLMGGLTFGPNARTSNMKRYTDGKTPASKLGFELGAMGNMAMGPVGRALAATTNRVPTGGN